MIMGRKLFLGVLNFLVASSSQAAHSGSSCSPWLHHWLQQMGTLPAPSHASHGVPCHGHGHPWPVPVLANIPKPSEACVRSRWDDTPVWNVVYTWVRKTRKTRALPGKFRSSLRGKDASYVQTGLTQVSQLSQWYQDWWKETQTINWSQAHFANPSSSTNQVKLRCFFMIFVQTALSHQSLRQWVPKVELIVWALTANTYSRASRSKINKQLLHGLGCLLSLTSKLELEMEKCKINNRVLPLHIRIVSLPSSNLEGHFGLSGKCHILFIWPCHSEIMQAKSSMSLWWCSQHTCPEMGVYRYTLNLRQC